MRKILIALVVGILTIAACKTSKTATKEAEEAQSQAYKDSVAAAEMFAQYAEDEGELPADDDVIELDEGWEVTAPADNKLEVYKESKTRTIDILHTKLDVKFDYEKQYLYGKAYITLKPYFYPTDIAVLDAKGFEVLGVFEMDKKKNTTPLKYEYKDLAKLEINLGRTYKANEEITIFINYIAKPNELPNGEGDNFDPSKAITQDKGLYFINPEFEIKNKPRQIWTQGETESSSCWFPTFDSPNERMTQEIIMTVDTPYVTLSNGKLIASKNNSDGTHTDHWKQDLPHAPYLAMMAVGDFAIVKDKWRNVPVHYYVEKEYEKYAKMIFGNTPKMMEFYSNILGVDYPWEKYHQIVVRDFVSGAMENTGAVVHFDLLQHDDRMHLDQPLEEVVAHELFHHWFGDLVTIESWANLPLNESFATYGEYLWMEHAYGREEADNHINTDLKRYLNEANDKKVPLVRFNHEKPDDMFDAHSYQKGGRVLHMLRKYVGDDAFFKSLNVYLTKNKYKSVEMHQLRMAFEEVTGEDLNWFFNQWFYNPGHPVISVIHDYDSTANLYTIKVTQIQDGEGVPKVYRLPVKVDIYNADGTKRTEDVIIDEGYEKLDFFVDSKPLWVNFDAEKMLLCEKTEVKEAEQWIEQVSKGPLFMDRLEAANQTESNTNDEFANSILRACISDKFWAMRDKGLSIIKENDLLSEEKDGRLKKRVAYLAENDKKSTVRRSALALLTEVKDEADIPLFKKLVSDSSYFVAGEAITGLAQLDSAAAVDFAEKNYLKEKKTQMGPVYLYVLGKYGTQNYMPWFKNAVTENGGGEMAFLLASGIGSHMLNGDEDRVLQGLDLLESMNSGEGQQNWFMMFIMFGIKKDVNKKYIPIYKSLLEKQQTGAISADDEEKMVVLNKILSKTGGLDKLEQEEVEELDEEAEETESED